MPNFYYTDANGQRGLINEQQLKTLVTLGQITPDTLLETETGQKGKAGQIKGLFTAPPAPATQAMLPNTTAQYFYTDANGQKQGAFNLQILQALAAQGIITSQTPMETATGQKGLAGQIPGLFPTTPPPPSVDSGLEIEVYDYRRIALAHRLSTVSIFTYILGFIFGIVLVGLSDETRLIGLGLILGSMVFSIFCMWRLATLVHCGLGTKIFLSICLLAPLHMNLWILISSWIPLFTVYVPAGNGLKEAGYSVGLLGADMRQFDDD